MQYGKQGNAIFYSTTLEEEIPNKNIPEDTT